MKITEKIIIIFMLSFSFSAYAEDTEMVPIEEFLKSEGSGKDEFGDAAKTFVGLRCTSLYLIWSSLLRDSGENDLAQKFDRIAELALGLAQSVKPFNEDYSRAQIRIMVDGYKDRWLKAKAMTGNASDDQVIRSDMHVCAQIFS